MKNKFCRNCKNNKFFNLLSLGKISFTGKFSKSLFNNIPKAYLNLVMCKKCKLVQLDRNFNPKYLYGKDYGYRSGINKTMTEHLKATAINAVACLIEHWKNSERPETIVSGRSEFFQCSTKQAVSFIANAFKMAKKLNNDVLKIAQYAKQYIEKKLNYLPINMARWVSQI